MEGLEGGLAGDGREDAPRGDRRSLGSGATAAWLDLEADPPPELDDAMTGSPSASRARSISWSVLGLNSPPVLSKRRGRPDVARRPRCASQSTTAIREPLPPPLPFSAPRTSFNLAITPHRRVCFGEAALEDLKAVKNRFGCTVNDVVLALCAGALRRYLLARGELPEEPLVALVPRSVRADEERLSGGNRLSAMLTSLATDIADPIVRLRTISAAMSEAKSQESLIGAEVLTDWTRVHASRSHRRCGSPDHLDAAVRSRPAGVQCHDLEYPGAHRFLCSWPERVWPAFIRSGPVVEGAGLNMTVMSYCGTVYFGLNGCRRPWPASRSCR